VNDGREAVALGLMLLAVLLAVLIVNTWR